MREQSEWRKCQRKETELLKDADARFVAEFGSFHDGYEKGGYDSFSYERYEKVEKMWLSFFLCCIGGTFLEEAVRYAMEELWEAADEGEIDLEELQRRLQQVADWVSHVEKVVGEKQPEWVNYY